LKTERKTESSIMNKSDNKILWELKLYVAGMTLRSQHAVQSVQNVCDKFLNGNYDLEVIDLYQQLHLAEKEQIVATPTLIKKAPPPVRRIIGDMSDTKRLVRGLDLQTEAAE